MKVSALYGLRRALLVVAAAGTLSVGCADSDGSSSRDASAECEPMEVDQLTPSVLGRIPHDPEAFTQGLVMVDGVLYESTGLRGSSTLRATDPRSGEVTRSKDVPDDVFAEGLALRDDGRLVQLTWTEGRAFVWDPESFSVVDEFSYEGEGWGLTAMEDGTFAMSDGTDEITERDPDTFEAIDSWTVKRSDGAADQLNELEWDGEHLWANRWGTDEILRIDPRCRRVDGVVDASELTAEVASGPGGSGIDVLNGIAHLPGTDRFLVTGKRWPTLFEVRFEELGSKTGTGTGTGAGPASPG